MPEPSDTNRKRSRSPSDADHHQSNKRLNKGPSTTTTTSPSDNKLTTAETSSPLKTGNDTDSLMTDAPSTKLPPKSQESAPPSESKPGESNGPEDTAAGPAASASTPAAPAAMIHMRCLIVTQDASIIIGKGGSHVNEIREKSGARVMVSESIPGNPERILNVSGPLDAVSKAFGLIVRRINDEPFDVPSVPGSRAVTIKFIIPNSRMGSVIGKAGAKIKEIQEQSGARLNASEGMLPGSTERILSVSGVADAIHIATYYIGSILIQTQDSGSSLSYRQPRPPRSYTDSSFTHFPHPYASAGPPLSIPATSAPLQTQQIYIPNDLVGCIIGKGGSKINEIRHMSASQIRIMEPGAVGVGLGGAPPPPANEGERLVVITGQPANIQMAVSLLYHRLEQEKQKQMQTPRV